MGQAPDLSDLTAALEAAGIYVAVEIRDGALIASGEVDSLEMRDAALDLAGAVAEQRGLTLEDAIEVLEIDVELPAEPSTRFEVDAGTEDRSLLSDVGASWTELAGEEGVPYFPPTDPVLNAAGGSGGDDLRIAGGFQPTAMDDDVDRPGRGDEEISELVRLELREDALTTDLAIQVRTVNGVVHLGGEVASPENAENAEAVAARVAGVREVREALMVENPLRDR
jgi:hyperosmotically inducible protein